MLRLLTCAATITCTDDMAGTKITCPTCAPRNLGPCAAASVEGRNEQDDAWHFGGRRAGASLERRA
jgi:hypothetical protein